MAIRAESVVPSTPVYRKGVSLAYAQRPHYQKPLTPWVHLCLLLLLTCGAFVVLGYHPGVEDDTTYLSTVKYGLNHALYPHDLQFVTAQLQLSLYDKLITSSVRFTHLPLATAILLWQFAGLFTFLLACWHIVARCFAEASARWAGVSFVAVMLAMPVSQSELFLVDQHLHPRLLATDCILFAILSLLGRRRVLAVALLMAGASLHPLMAAFGISFCFFLALEQAWPGWWMRAIRPVRTAAWVMPASWIFERPTAAWERATAPRTFLYLYKWPWYAWFTILGPIAVAGWLRTTAKRRGEPTLTLLSSAIVVYSLFQLATALVLLFPGAPAWFLQLEPMRFLYLLYLLTALLGAAAFGRFWLKHSLWHWLLIFLPLTVCMYVDQQMEFAGSPHMEWPGAIPSNPWLQAFAWVRTHTPVDAYFALDPLYTQQPLEGTHSFRALAERSMLTDDVKDRGVVTHVPHLAPQWIRETEATAGWKHFNASDFQKLHRQFGVDWVLVEHSVPGLSCPYHNNMIWVCRLSTGTHA